MKTDVLIVGGGLAGLSLADRLSQGGIDFQLVEARDRFGGRIETAQFGEDHFDLGPAWFWPGQPRIAALIDRLGLHRFDQHFQGLLSFEDETGRVERGRGFASMQGSWRLDGGLGGLVGALAQELPRDRLHLNAEVAEFIRSPDGIGACLADGRTVLARRIALAAPPRVIAHRVRFSPALPGPAQEVLSGIPTWMAGQAKAMAVYDTPFWRHDGLSGDATSRFGPMVEIHDASPAGGATGALFGFVGVPPSARLDEETVRIRIIAQLARIFGPKASAPEALFFKDWASDPFTATPADHRVETGHPAFGLPPILHDLWDGRIVFAGTEAAQQFGGYLEGALEAAEAAARRLARLTPQRRAS